MSEFDKSWFKINPQSVLPLYYQIKQNLLDLVGSGKFSSGESLPSEADMGEYYGVSRLTVRQAVGELVREGVLVRERGRGTFVALPKTTHRTVRSAGFSERIREAGQKPSSRVLGCEVIEATYKVAEYLQIPVDSRVYKLTRLRLVDDEPQIIETAYLSQEMFPGLDTIDFSQASLYSTLSEKFNCLVMASDEIFEPVLANNYEAGLLGMKPKSAALLLEIVAYDQFDRRVEYTKSIMRGDKARLLFHVRRQIINQQETHIQWSSSEPSDKV